MNENQTEIGGSAQPAVRLTDWLDARRKALIEAAAIVQDKLSWVEDGQRYFSNIGALEAHTEILARACNDKMSH